MGKGERGNAEDNEEEKQPTQIITLSYVNLFIRRTQSQQRRDPANRQQRHKGEQYRDPHADGESLQERAPGETQGNADGQKVTQQQREQGLYSHADAGPARAT